MTATTSVDTSLDRRTLRHNGDTRTYIVYEPDSLTEKTVPVVLTFHGFTGSADGMVDYADFRSLADEHGFIVVYPMGTLLNDTQTHWNVDGLTYGSETDDIDFVRTLLDALEQEYPVNRNRIYATGHSNGGYMSLQLACQLAGDVAAVASVAGKMTVDMSRSCEPTRPVPVLQMHATDDPVVPYDSGLGMSVDDTLKFWIDHNQTEAQPTITQVPPDEATTANSSVEIHTYIDGTDGSVVEHVKVLGGDHEWLGQSNSSGNSANLDLDLNNHIWDFFDDYDLDGTI